MSRKLRERRLEAEERWPNLASLLRRYLHEDRDVRFGSSVAAIDQAVAETGLADRQLVVKEWLNWNAVAGWKTDVVSSVNDGFGVNVQFGSEFEARQFMNTVYDKLIVSVRAELGKEWRP